MNLFSFFSVTSSRNPLLRVTQYYIFVLVPSSVLNILKKQFDNSAFNCREVVKQFQKYILPLF